MRLYITHHISLLLTSTKYRLFYLVFWKLDFMALSATLLPFFYSCNFSTSTQISLVYSPLPAFLLLPLSWLIPTSTLRSFLSPQVAFPFLCSYLQRNSWNMLCTLSPILSPHSSLPYFNPTNRATSEIALHTSTNDWMLLNAVLSSLSVAPQPLLPHVHTRSLT